MKILEVNTKPLEQEFLMVPVRLLDVTCAKVTRADTRMVAARNKILFRMLIGFREKLCYKERE